MDKSAARFLLGLMAGCAIAFFIGWLTPVYILDAIGKALVVIAATVVFGRIIYVAIWGK